MFRVQRRRRMVTDRTDPSQELAYAINLHQPMSIESRTRRIRTANCGLAAHSRRYRVKSSQATSRREL